MPVHDYRMVTSSNGEQAPRYVIKTPLVLGEMTHMIELTLTDRSLMRFNLLLGREALSRFVLLMLVKSICSATL